MLRKSTCRKPTQKKITPDDLERLNCAVMDELMFLNERVQHINEVLGKLKIRRR